MLLRPLLDLLFPPLCHVCRAFLPCAVGNEVPHLCAECLGQISFIDPPLCTVCGAPFETREGRNHLCGACLTHPPFHTCRSAAVLHGPVQELIHRFKYGGKVHLGHPLGLLAANTLEAFYREVDPDCIIPVPLHRKRLRQRGYNQSQVLGAVLERKWKVPQEVGNLRRTRWTEPQTGLDAADRVTNVAGAFEVRHPRRFKGKRVLLVDDVLTTGSTMRACAEALKDVGAAAVAAVTVARGLQQ